jgi:hypothetical protein
VYVITLHNEYLAIACVWILLLVLLIRIAEYLRNTLCVGDSKATEMKAAYSVYGRDFGRET